MHDADAAEASDLAVAEDAADVASASEKPVKAAAARAAEASWLGSQVDGPPVVGGAVEREGAQGEQIEEQQPPAGSHERRLAAVVALGDEKDARRERAAIRWPRRGA